MRLENMERFLELSRQVGRERKQAFREAFGMSIRVFFSNSSSGRGCLAKHTFPNVALLTIGGQFDPF